MGTETMCVMCGRVEGWAASSCSRELRERSAVHQERRTAEADCYRIGYARERARAEAAEAAQRDTQDAVRAAVDGENDARAALAAAEAQRDLLRDAYAAMRAEAQERERVQALEMERHRHGDTIESDGICPDSLALTEARAALAIVTRTLGDVTCGADMGCDQPVCTDDEERAEWEEDRGGECDQCREWRAAWKMGFAALGGAK